MSNILLHQTPREKDAQLIERVAQALSSLSDFDLKVIGASSSRASNAVRAAAMKAAKARSTKYALAGQLATIDHEIQQSKRRLDDLEVELAAAQRDRSGDDWSREQRVNQVRAKRSDFRQRLKDQDKARRAHIRAYGE